MTISESAGKRSPSAAARGISTLRLRAARIRASSSACLASSEARSSRRSPSSVAATTAEVCRATTQANTTRPNSSQPAAAAIPQREGEDPVQAPDEVDALVLVQMRQQLGVTSGPERVPLRQ